MKKISFISLFLSILLFGCSSSDNSSSVNNVYFNFTVDNKNYNSSDYEQGDICWSAQINQTNSKVDLLMSFTNPSDNLTYCGVTLSGINNNIGNSSGCDFGIMNGDETIANFSTNVELTEVGNFYVGTFSGNFLIIQNGSSSITRSGSGSFRIPKQQ